MRTTSKKVNKKNKKPSLTLGFLFSCAAFVDAKLHCERANSLLL